MPSKWVIVFLLLLILPLGCRTRRMDRIKRIAPIRAVSRTNISTPAAQRTQKIQASSPSFSMVAEISRPSARGLEGEFAPDFMPIDFIEGCGLEDFAEMLRIEEVHGIDIDEIVDIFRIATYEGTDLEVIADVYAIAKVEGIPLLKVSDIFKLAMTKGIPLQIVANIAKEALIHKIPIGEVVGIAALVQKSGLPITPVIAVYRELMIQGVDVDIRLAVLPLITIDSIEAIDIAIAKISQEQEIPISRIRIAVMATILAVKTKAPSVKALLPYAPLFKSRWEVLTPEEYSELWNIKCRAEEMEALGLNTDALWNEFWDILLRMPD